IGRAAAATTHPSSVRPTPPSASWKPSSARRHRSTTAAAHRCPVLRPPTFQQIATIRASSRHTSTRRTTWSSTSPTAMPRESPRTLGLNHGDIFFVSVSAVDAQGHESLFAYPEVRCDSAGCAIPSYAYNVTAPLPPPAPAKDPAEDD